MAVKKGCLSSQDTKNSVFGINISTMTFAGSAQDIKISGQIYNLQQTITCVVTSNLYFQFFMKNIISPESLDSISTYFDLLMKISTSILMW